MARASLGWGLLYDLGGDDTYGVRSVGLGAGLGGFGLLADLSGDDRYRVVGVGLGAGFKGMGIAVDRAGDDTYDAGKAGEGYGAVARSGAGLVDNAGRDSYRGGEWVQATGRNTGFGLLTDGAGKDAYFATTGQASAPRRLRLARRRSGRRRLPRDGERPRLCDQRRFRALARRLRAKIPIFCGRGRAKRPRSGAWRSSWTAPATTCTAARKRPRRTAYANGVALMIDGDGDDRYLASAPFERGTEGVALWIDGRGKGSVRRRTPRRPSERWNGERGLRRSRGCGR